MNDLKSGGRWTIEEARNYINYLELLACFSGLKSFCSAVTKKNIRLSMDNTTAISYINNMGGITSKNVTNLQNKSGSGV